MEVREATIILDAWKSGACNPNLNYHKSIDDIISLLQDLGKYREMMNKFEKEEPISMNYYKQKYFPQPVKKVITIEVEVKDDIEINWFKNYIKTHIDKILDNYEVKVNIKVG